jgi:GH18 family chitinase
VFSCAIFFGLAPAAIAQQRKIVGYVPNWINLTKYVNEIDYAKLTHINIAFENPSNDNGDLSFNKQNPALIEKAHANKVLVLVSIGGGSASEDKTLLKRYADLLSDSKRAGFVGKLADYVVQHGLDGLDVDLEGPAIGPAYGAFIADLAKALKPKGKLLTSALSQGYGGDKVPSSVFPLFDFVNVMAYDGTGPWDKNRAGQHSSFEYAKSNMGYWLSRGLPKSKAVLGVPFYGWGFGEAYTNNDYRYSDLIAKYPGAENLDQVGNTIWYNGMPTIKAKAQYVVDQGMAGIMIWELDYDAKGEKSLLKVIYDTLNPKSASISSIKKP